MAEQAVPDPVKTAPDPGGLHPGGLHPDKLQELATQEAYWAEEPAAEEDDAVADEKVLMTVEHEPVTATVEPAAEQAEPVERADVTADAPSPAIAQEMTESAANESATNEPVASEIIPEEPALAARPPTAERLAEIMMAPEPVVSSSAADEAAVDPAPPAGDQSPVDDRSPVAARPPAATRPIGGGLFRGPETRGAQRSLARPRKTREKSDDGDYKWLISGFVLGGLLCLVVAGGWMLHRNRAPELALTAPSANDALDRPTSHSLAATTTARKPEPAATKAHSEPATRREASRHSVPEKRAQVSAKQPVRRTGIIEPAQARATTTADSASAAASAGALVTPAPAQAASATSKTKTGPAKPAVEKTSPAGKLAHPTDNKVADQPQASATAGSIADGARDAVKNPPPVDLSAIVTKRPDQAADAAADVPDTLDAPIRHDRVVAERGDEDARSGAPLAADAPRMRRVKPFPSSHPKVGGEVLSARQQVREMADKFEQIPGIEVEVK